MEQTAQQPNFFFLIISFVVIFYFFVIRPQQKREKEKKAMITNLKKGDKIITNGGIFAKVINVKEDCIIARIANDVKIEISKDAVNLISEDKPNQ